MTNWNEIHRLATTWVKEAGERIKASFSEELTIATKSHRNDLVTDMDKATEQFLIGKIHDHFPSHRILSEEGFGDDFADVGGIIWVIDPIDGTMNFIHQQRNFAISIGVFHEGVGKVGMIYDVVHDEMYHTISGEGAYMNDTKLKPLTKGEVKDAIIGINATWVTSNKRIDSSYLAPLVKDARGTRSYGSAALEMAYVASGRLDAYISLRLAPWDYGGGMILINEVGGKTTNLKGEALMITPQTSVFVARPGVHEEILQQYLNSGNW
ncbi:inositol monophosphatase family protein [Cytobacillus kochii]|uniref:inositol monophosphatase family protein n=1 Tax=Cytobacillus kochii TaxID=859143 RepID=UPI002480D3C2|nr:inositol monophosphatase family protein [Cytobacillus kochii]